MNKHFVHLSHRLYQQNCCCVLGHYVKDLSVLQRDPMRTVILDNAPHTYPYHVRILPQLRPFLVKYPPSCPPQVKSNLTLPSPLGFLFPLQLMNMIPVKSWFGEEDDQELQRLIPHLEKLAEAVCFPPRPSQQYNRTTVGMLRLKTMVAVHSNCTLY